MYRLSQICMKLNSDFCDRLVAFSFVLAMLCYKINIKCLFFLRYSEYMSKKQKVFSLPIIFKNESRSEDCLDIMDSYEEQLTDIFSQAYGKHYMLNYLVSLVQF